MCKSVSTLFGQDIHIGVLPNLGFYTNSTDPVQMQQTAAYDHLCCMLTEISMKNAVKIKTSTKEPPKTRNSLI